jgi:hypothetical protein
MGGSWIVEVINTAVGAENFINIALDETDMPHVCFYSSNGSLIYSYLNGTTWTSEEVDANGNAGLYCSIGVMPILNWPSIAYYCSTDRTLKFARKENGVWVIRVVDASGDVGRNGNLALDPSGRPFICYQHASEPAEIGLRIAWLNPDGWTTINLSENNINGYDISMEIDEFGTIHISYRDYQHVYYAWYNGVSWGINNAIAGTDANGMTSISVDNDRNPSIVFWDGADLKFVDTYAGAYEGPIVPDNTSLSSGGGGGCFIATAAFGVYASTDVVALTSVRDALLTSTDSGSSLVALYYAVSPVTASKLANSDALRAFIRELLNN